MPNIGSETHRSSELPESATKETKISESAAPPDVVKGEDWPQPEPPEPPPDPTLDSLTPESIPVPGPDAYVIIAGSNFTPAAVVSWDEDPVPCEFISETELKVLVTTYSIGVETLPFEIPVSVEVEDRMSNTLMFTYENAEVRSKKGRDDSKR